MKSGWVTVNSKEHVPPVGTTVANERRGIRPTRVAEIIPDQGIRLQKSDPSWGDIVITDGIRVRVVEKATK